MSDKKEKKFYWSTGVTRNEVVQSLNDTRHSVFRNQSNRRGLVALTAFVLLAQKVLEAAAKSVPWLPQDNEWAKPQGGK